MTAAEPAARAALPPCAASLRRAFALAAALAAAVVSSGCAVVPPSSVEPTYTREPAVEGGLARVAARVDAELAPGASAVHLLVRNDAAYSARLALVGQAVETLDIQYFLWGDDATAYYLARRMIAAAQRGVRVRVLLDDLALVGHDADYAALDRHPRIEVRTFNPWRSRSRIGRLVEFLLRMDALNHRMHNKAIIADNLFALTGGRNVGNHYFGLNEAFIQNDLDVLVAGPAVRDMSAHFDLYWNSEHAYPIESVLKRRHDERTFEGVVADLERTYMDDRERLSAFLPHADDRHAAFLESIAGDFAQGPVEVIFDLPDIDAAPPTQLYSHFSEVISRAEREVLISSPYFVPDQAFVDLLAGLVDRGVRVVVLTNTLGANNHVTAHSAYKKWRRKVLRAGVELYEARRDAETLSYYLTPPVESNRLGLHTKAFVVDGRLSFVGSPNVDPRSMLLNTEMGVVIDDVTLSARLRDLFERDTAPENAWRVRLTEDNFLAWTNDEETIWHQPARGFLQRMVEFFVNLLPIKNQT